MIQVIKQYCLWRAKQGLDMWVVPVCREMANNLIRKSPARRKYVTTKGRRCRRCGILLRSKYAGKHDYFFCSDCLIASVRKNTCG